MAESKSHSLHRYACIDIKTVCPWTWVPANCILWSMFWKFSCPKLVHGHIKTAPTTEVSPICNTLEPLQGLFQKQDHEPCLQSLGQRVAQGFRSVSPEVVRGDCIFLFDSIYFNISTNISYKPSPEVPVIASWAKYLHSASFKILSGSRFSVRLQLSMHKSKPRWWIYNCLHSCNELK